MRKQSDSETLEQLYDLYEQKMYAVAVISLIPASAYAAQFDEDYVIAREEFDANGRDAVLLTFDSRTGYDKTAYVIFDDLQYVAEVSMGKGIATDEDGNMTAFMMDRYILTRRIAVPIQTGIISLQR